MKTKKSKLLIFFQIYVILHYMSSASTIHLNYLLENKNYICYVRGRTNYHAHAYKLIMKFHPYTLIFNKVPC
jgi:ribosomal protein S17